MSWSSLGWFLKKNQKPVKTGKNETENRQEKTQKTVFYL